MYMTGNECRNNLHRNHKNHSIKANIVNETVTLQAFIRQDSQDWMAHVPTGWCRSGWRAQRCHETQGNEEQQQ